MIRFRSRLSRLGLWVTAALTLCFPLAASAAKPSAIVYSDVQITFAGQTFGFSGAEQSFNQSGGGGRIAFQVNQLSTPGYLPLPDVDVSVLEPAGNHWVIQLDHGRSSELFAGTCASETYTTSEGGVVVRHLNLNCRDIDLP